jgi:hypothetical protein
MAIDITGFQRMRREQAKKRQPAEAAPAWDAMTFNELRAAAKKAGIDGYRKMSKAELIEALKAGE